MYDKKLKYLRNGYKRSLLMSGISTTVVNYFPVGSPCIGIIDSRDCFKKSSPGNISRPSLEDMHKIVEKRDEAKIRSLLNNHISNITLMFPFNMGTDGLDLVTAALKIDYFHYINKPPLIHDTSHNSNLSMGEGLKSYIQDVQKLPTLIYEQLKSNRFINYTFYDIKKSNVSDIESYLKAIIKVLSKEYPSKISYHKHNTRNRVLIDTMSISFYNLIDIIPIFDRKKSEGVGIDIMLTNSEVEPDRIMSEGYSLLFRFIFGRYRENIFTLDGAAIQRPWSQPVNEIIERICSLLKSECPRDKKISKKAAKK